MFLENKYSKWYYNIINNAKSRTSPKPKETHHILPRCLNGDNNKNNLVDLTIREHYVCHLLLTKFTIGNARKKMFYALHRITNKSGLKIKSSKIYEYLRLNHSKSVSEKFKGKTIFELYGRSYMHDISDFQKQQISKSNHERIWSEESKLKISKSQKQRKIDRPNSFNIGVPKSKEHKENMSKSRLNKFRKNDIEIFTWSHPTYDLFIGTRSQLRDRFPDQNLKVSELAKVINPKYPEKSYKKWRLS